MKGLERMITRVKQHLSIGRQSLEVYEELIGQGCDEALVHWALRSAQFELDKEEILAKERKQYENV